MEQTDDKELEAMHSLLSAYEKACKAAELRLVQCYQQKSKDECARDLIFTKISYSSLLCPRHFSKLHECVGKNGENWGESCREFIDKATDCVDGRLQDFAKASRQILADTQASPGFEKDQADLKECIAKKNPCALPAWKLYTHNYKSVESSYGNLAACAASIQGKNRWEISVDEAFEYCPEASQTFLRALTVAELDRWETSGVDMKYFWGKLRAQKK